MDREEAPNFESLSDNVEAIPKETNRPQKRKGKKKKPISKKRFVKTVKVFLTDEEIHPILEKCHDYGGISNYIRHHLGLPMNTPGRKRKHTAAALDLDLLDL